MHAFFDASESIDIFPYGTRLKNLWTATYSFGSFLVLVAPALIVGPNSRILLLVLVSVAVVGLFIVLV